MVTFQDIKDSPIFTMLIEKSNSYLRARGYRSTDCAMLPTFQKTAPF